MLGSKLVIVIRLSGFANWSISNLGPCSHPETGWIEALSSWWLHFKGICWLPGSWQRQRHPWTVEDLYLKGAEKEITIAHFSKLTVLRKRSNERNSVRNVSKILPNWGQHGGRPLELVKIRPFWSSYTYTSYTYTYIYYLKINKWNSCKQCYLKDTWWAPRLLKNVRRGAANWGHGTNMIQ